MATTVAEAGVPAKFKASKKEMTMIITGIEVGMGLIEALILVNIINFFQKMPLRLPTFMEVVKITLTLAFTGFLGGIVSANIIEKLEQKKELSGVDTTPEQPAQFSNFSNVYNVQRVPVSWMIPSVQQLPKHLQPKN